MNGTLQPEMHNASEPAASAFAGRAAAAPPIVHRVLCSPGRPLDAATRGLMESRFEHDFSRVRVHTDEPAAESARAVNAVAYTVGSHVAFATGQYAPGSPSGRRLLAHELAHTVQQEGGLPLALPSGLTIGSPADAPEREAERTARSITEPAGRAALPLQRLPGPVLQRQIPIPGFDEFDPCIIVPDGLPAPFDKLKGQKVCGSTAKAIIDFLRGKKKGENTADCRGFPGFKPGGSKAFKDQCCRGIESKENCCPPDRLAFRDLRCCADDEVIVDGKCVKSSSLPPLPPSLFCPSRQQTLDGKCCLPPLVPLGTRCILPPVAPPPKPQPVTPVSVEIFFKRDRPSTTESGDSAVRSGTTSEGLSNFQGLVEQMTADPSLGVELIGRASPEGTEVHNLVLGGRRANAVADALVAAGINSSRIMPSPVADLRAECQQLRPGVVTCGEAGATGDRDRQVLARFFSRPSTP